MRNFRRPFQQFILTLIFICSFKSQAETPKVIYGNDDRYEVENYHDRVYREYAKSVAGKIAKFKLKTDPSNPNYFSFSSRSMENWNNLCPSERFAKQNTLPNCTGFLIAPNLLVTAGHCVRSKFECKAAYWVFDYVAGTKKISKENAFKCKKLVRRELHSSWFTLKDYAIVQLDRNVQSFRKPLPVKTKTKRSKIGTPLVVIGFPSGAPMKIADGAKVKAYNIFELLTPIRSMIRRAYYFNANLDTFGGNSGSPIFNQNTNEVIGILIQGAKDYIRSPNGNNCSVVNNRSNSGFYSIEKAFRIHKIPRLNRIIKRYTRRSRRD